MLPSSTTLLRGEILLLHGTTRSGAMLSSRALKSPARRSKSTGEKWNCRCVSHRPRDRLGSKVTCHFHAAASNRSGSAPLRVSLPRGLAGGSRPGFPITSPGEIAGALSITKAARAWVEAEVADNSRAARPNRFLKKFFAAAKRTSDAPPNIEHRRKQAKILI